MALISIAVSWGFGRHLTSLNPTRSIQALKYESIQQPFHVMSSCFGRISFALFLVEIIQNFITRRRFLYLLMALQFAVNGITAIIIMVQCRPIQKLWNHKVEGDCWNPRVQEYYSFFQGCKSKYRPAKMFLSLTNSASFQHNHRLYAGTYISGLPLVIGEQLGATPHVPGAEASFSSQIVLLVGRNPNFLFFFSGPHLKKSDFDFEVKPVCLIVNRITYLFLGTETLRYSSDLPEMPDLSS